MTETQIDRLANFIMSEEVLGEPSHNEGAGDCAIRLIRELQLDLSQAEVEKGSLIDEMRQFWPRTLREAVRMLYARMSDEDIGEWCGLTEENAIEFHSNLGRRIRNGFGLWLGNEALLRDLGVWGQAEHEMADGGSDIIIKHLIAYVHGLHGIKPTDKEIVV